ncbi:unnamed protein product [Gongylonema pulchrum]|uniref:GT23 domain-containing protein n=1 Tax=Gongylonema pulchrum TaxID=637853 RepID=A0A183DNK0_9BILA|nr:unnamed protein product [Gongylonema pulchrum]
MLAGVHYDDMVRRERAACACCSMGRLVFAAFTFWILIFLYLAISLFTVQLREKDTNEQKDFSMEHERAAQDLMKLRRENDGLRKLLRKETQKKIEIKKKYEHVRAKLTNAWEKRQKTDRRAGTSLDDAFGQEALHPHFSTEYEMARRAVHNSIWELYYYLNSQFSWHKNLPFENHARNQMLSLLGQSAALGNIDSADYWRTKELANISANFHEYFNKMQNPDDCQAVRILTCDLNKRCGFGCQLHHVAYCFIVAYGSNRTLVLTYDGRSWNYASRGWNYAFLPISKCSFSQIFKPNEKQEDWTLSGDMRNSRILQLPVVDSLSDRPSYLPLAIPQSISNELLKLHSNPPAFFLSQVSLLLKFCMIPLNFFNGETDVLEAPMISGDRFQAGGLGTVKLTSYFKESSSIVA